MVAGTHILINAGARHVGRLIDDQAFGTFMTELLDILGLIQIGKVLHPFAGGGFTGVVCLTESHLAIHTWPEFGYYTCDVYLCDYTRPNYQLTCELAEAIKTYFDSHSIKEQIIQR